MKSIIKAMVLAGTMIVPSGAHAQTFPSKPVTLVIPFSVGASNDTFGRYIADALSKEWKQPVVIENRPGAGSGIGMAYVAKAKPDGYTLAFGSSSVAVNAAVAQNLPFDSIKDLQPVALAASGQLVVVTGSRVPLRSVADVIREAKAQKIFYGSSGLNTTAFAAELFNEAAGIKMEPVVYKGGTEALVDVAGGRLDIFFGDAFTVSPSIQNKSATPIATLGKTRLKSLPDVPTIAEAGYPNAAMGVWWGFFGPAGMPQDVVTKIHAAINKIMAVPATAEFLERSGAAPETMSVEDFSKLYLAEIEKLKALAKSRNLQ